jgi:hypothetical protein
MSYFSNNQPINTNQTVFELFPDLWDQQQYMEYQETDEPESTNDNHHHLEDDSDDDLGFSDADSYFENVRYLQMLIRQKTNIQFFMILFEGKSSNSKHNFDYSIIVPSIEKYRSFIELIQRKQDMNSTEWNGKMWNMRKEMKQRCMILNRNIPPMNLATVYVPALHH